MWTTWVKPGAAAAADFSRATLKAITASSSGESRVPSRGRDAVVSLWIDGLPAACHLGNLEVAFGQARTRGCYLSAIGESGGCQLNVRVPKGTAPGAVEVALWFEDRRLGEPKVIEVLPPAPRDPRALSVSDGIAITAKYRIEMGGVKVTMEDVERPEEVSFTVAGRPAEFLQFECKDPVTDTYEFAFHLSHNTPLGRQTLIARVSGRELAPIPIEIAGLSEAAKLQDGETENQQCDGQAQGAGDAPLRAAVEGKRNLTRALARWFHHQKP
jgi:hypothetical protein